jgi:hypothetical protein
MAILVLAEHDVRSLKSSTSHVVTAAQKLGADIDVLVAGYHVDGAAQAAARLKGVSKVRVVDASHLELPTAENLAAVLIAIVKGSGYTHVLAPATAFGKNVMPRVAAVLDVAQISDITAIESADTFVRPIYAGNAFATVQSKDPVKIVTVRTTAFESAGEQGAAPIELLTPPDEIVSAKVVGEELSSSARTRAHERSDRHFRGSRSWQRRQFQIVGSARRQVECRNRCIARRGRCRLCAKRLPGRSNRQDRRARSVHRDRNLRRDPAPRRDEGQQSDRGNQQGSRGADFSNRRLWSGCDLFEIIPQLTAKLAGP